jgi:putative ABC transport system permease protein
MAELRDDLRFAARLLRKSPGSTAVALLTLALAIGANTAIFSVVNGVLLRPLPFPRSEQLFWLMRNNMQGSTPLSIPQYAFLSAKPQPFARLAAWPGMGHGFNMSGEGRPELVAGQRVTRSFFEVLGVQPSLGRAFLPEEDVPGGPRVVVLSQGIWRQRFGGRSDVLGRTLTLNGEPYTVIGVMPPGFEFPDGSQLWVPLGLDMANTEDAHYLMVVGRVKAGVDLDQVGAQVREQGEELRALRAGALRPEHWLDALALRSMGTLYLRPALLVLLGAVGLVLLIACVNLANLQLARAGTRERELVLRAALGARSGRLARQLLTESILLSGLGGGLGLLLAVWALPALLVLAPQGTPLLENVRIDGTVLAFTFGVSVLTGLLFGLLPAWQASRQEARGSLRVGALSVTSGPPASLTRRLLVVGEVALAVVLLIGASLLTRSFIALQAEEPGFDPEGVLTVKLSLPEARYGNPAAMEAYIQRVVERVKALPGVQAVGFASTLPFEPGSRMDFALHRRQQGGEGAREMGEALYRPVTRGYFQALRIELVRGRLLDDLDHRESALVAVINETTARRYWPGQDPIGQHITIGGGLPRFADPGPREIIGVVRDVRELHLQVAAPSIIYLPLGQVPQPFLEHSLSLVPQTLLIRTGGDAASLATAIEREIQAVDPMQPVTEIASMEELVARSLGTRRFTLWMMGLMAGLALALAVVGIYGVLSYLVNQRAQELGVRLALGATRAQVVWLVLRQGLAMVGVGVGLGVLGALGITRLFSHLLYAVSPLDPVAFVAAPAVLMVVALVATWLPAMRASRVDPMVALRAE